jgi:hypothetical protein
MEQDIKKQIKEIIGDIQCPREFCCLETGFDRSCKTKDVGLEGHLECLEEDASHCFFSTSFEGGMYFCSCPFSVYICKKLGK